MLTSHMRRPPLLLLSIFRFCLPPLPSTALESQFNYSARHRPYRFKTYKSITDDHSSMPKRKSLTLNTSNMETHIHNNSSPEQQKTINYYLLKSEPSDYSISDLQRDHTQEWNGIRNYQARNTLRKMNMGDRAFFYHSKASSKNETGIVGSCKIACTAQPDWSALDPNSEYFDAKCTKENCRWDSVLIEYEQTFPVILSLKEIKQIALSEPDGVIAGLGLLKQSRLSVFSLTLEEWVQLMQLIDKKTKEVTQNRSEIIV